MSSGTNVRRATVLALMLVSAAAFADAAPAAAAYANTAPAGCTAATEFSPRLCPLRLPRLRDVVIERNALPTEPGADCTRFVLQERDVRRYFARARRVAGPQAEHDVDRGPCAAEGRLSLADGPKAVLAQWRIEQIGSATLVIGGAPRMTLLCTRCTEAPYRDKP